MKGTSNAAAITEYLKARPCGANAVELASYLNTSDESAAGSLERLLARGLVERDPGTRMSAVWTLIATEPTPPIFRAMETLKAMQAAARHE
jgi:DNA-binding IclR family transcriptional regulator